MQTCKFHFTKNFVQTIPTAAARKQRTKICAIVECYAVSAKLEVHSREVNGKSFM